MATAAKTEKTAVEMEDGSTVEFTAKQKVVKTTTIDEAAGTVSTRFDFKNGAVRFFTIPAAMLLKFAGHGAEQKIGDALAGEESIEDGVEAVTDLITRLNAGEWNAKREKGAFSGQSILLRALVEAFAGKKTADECREFLAGKSAAEKIALRGSNTLAPIVQRLEAEKAAKSKKPTISGDELLGGLLGD